MRTQLITITDFKVSNVSLVKLIVQNLILHYIEDFTVPKEDTLKSSNTAPSQTAPPVYETPVVNPTASAQTHTIPNTQSGHHDGDNAYDYVESTSRAVTNKTQVCVHVYIQHTINNWRI